MKNPFNTPHNGMFTVSKVKTKFKLKDGGIQHHCLTNDTYDLRNINIYCEDTRELIRIETQSDYNTSFIFKLSDMYIPNVKPFLTHQLKGSNKPTEFIDYVKYSTMNNERIKSKGIKQAIKDWLEDNQTIEKSVIRKSIKYENSIRVTKKVTKEDTEQMGYKVGTEYSTIPEPKNKAELFEQFEKLHAQRHFEALQDEFIKKYGNPTDNVIKDELNEINNFIIKANQLTTTETFNNKWTDPRESDLYEYSRLSNNYYKNENKPFQLYGYFNDNAQFVYARYFLFKDWLKSLLDAYAQPQQEVKTEIEHPFSSENNFELFKHFNKYFKKGGEKSKYTYLFKYFIDTDNDLESFTQKQFFTFASKFTGIKLGNQKQDTATTDYSKLLNKIKSDFDKLKEGVKES